jgi:hypothetical protein
MYTDGFFTVFFDDVFLAFFTDFFVVFLEAFLTVLAETFEKLTAVTAPADENVIMKASIDEAVFRKIVFFINLSPFFFLFIIARPLCFPFSADGCI